MQPVYPFAAAAVAINLFLAGLIAQKTGLQPCRRCWRCGSRFLWACRPAWL
jgi:hypothetical protein